MKTTAHTVLNGSTVSVELPEGKFELDVTDWDDALAYVTKGAFSYAKLNVEIVRDVIANCNETGCFVRVVA